MRFKGIMIDGVFASYGPGCCCPRCTQKIGNEGFHRAKESERMASEAERNELERWSALRLESLPPVMPGETLEQYRARVGERAGARSVSFDDFDD